MSDAHDTAPAVAGKPAKPYPEFPLFAHATRRWAKKIRGKLHYFGPWDDPDAAFQSYQAQKDALHSGRKPRPDAATVSIKDLANAFLAQKQSLLDSGELTARTWAEYKATTDLLVSEFGKHRAAFDVGPDDFAALRDKLARRFGPVTLGNAIQRVRCVFKFGTDNGLIETTVRFGQGFARPSKKTLRLHRAGKGPKMFTRDEIRAMVVAASLPLRAMILLGVNCGFGNADCGTLPTAALDLEGGWVNYHRPKTGISRRCRLWPETVAALREWIAVRPEPTDPANSGLVFVTAYGGRWYKDIADNPITKETRKLLDRLGINGCRNFYALRHTFETIGGDAKDQVAVDAIMGHARDDMASVYRERISDERLRAVADHVRAWLSGVPSEPKPDGKESGG